MVAFFVMSFYLSQGIRSVKAFILTHIRKPIIKDELTRKIGITTYFKP